jgi:sulfide:quinone oxidoreductase
VYAAGDATDFPVKHGGIASQQADVVAESIAALAGCEIEPQGFQPVVQGVLLTNESPRYIAARITGGCGFSSHFSSTPIEGESHKIAAKYLTPYLQKLARARVPA